MRDGEAEPAQMVPGVAPAAKQMGAYVGRAIRASIEGRRPLGPFRYRDYGTLATIGRRAAVVQLPFTRLSGGVAWWFWVVAHLVYLIGFRNRMVVLIDWAWAYVSYQRAARIVMIHDGGPADRRLDRLRARFPDADAVVFGHSHLPLHEERDGFHIFNPGSPTERRRAPEHTMGLATARDGRLEFSLVPL